MRRAGGARDREGSADGVFCHAAPVRDAGATVAAVSISLSGEAETRGAERYDEIVRAAAVSIARRMQATREETSCVSRAGAA